MPFKRHLVRGHVLNYSYTRLQTCWIHSEDIVPPLSLSLYHKCWPVCAMFGLAVHQFVKVKKYLEFVRVWILAERQETQFQVQFFFVLNKKKMFLAHNDEDQSRNWPPDAVQGKSKQISFHTETSDSWCVRSGWHTVRAETLWLGEAVECLCRLFLVPLGIPANLHLCQLDVADDIGVCKTKTGKGWFISCSGRKRASVCS